MSPNLSGRILPDVTAETLRLLGEANQANVPLRVLGGMAVFLHVGDLLHPSLSREIRDIDFATPKGNTGKVSQFLVDQGYEPNRAFNAMHGDRRLLFYDEPSRRQIDVFIGAFEMCHALPLSERMLLEPVTLPLAELLMTKLQIVKLNQKDRNDVYALLLTHEVGANDSETVNLTRIAELCAKDWGLYRTFQLNLKRLDDGLLSVELTPADRATISQRLRAIDHAIEAEPKSAKWKMRARVGDRVRWYEDPEEVDQRGY
jgi:hypothetical protein